MTALAPELRAEVAQEQPSPAVPLNPYPGPQPYRAVDRDRFFGREDQIRRLANRILAYPCITLFGPSGAGKSSLMQAGVIPWLEEAHAFRVVYIDAWPPGNPPLGWFMRALFEELDLGEPPEEASLDAIEGTLRLAKQRSARPILIYLDQLEQILFPERDAGQAAALIEAMDRVARLPMRRLHLVLAFREDYLGRFRDRAQGRRELLDHGFRLAPLSVGEMEKAVCRAAASGAPPQTWSREEARRLMLQVRTPGQSESPEAEVQAVFAQIVCRALWEERAAAGGVGGELGPVEAEAILHRHLEATLDALGPLKEGARALLEEHLIDHEGRRRMLSEEEARSASALPDGAAAEVLAHLERAAVLRAMEHQGSRWFQLGHDWLAVRVLARRQEREREESERRQEQEREELERRREESEQRQREVSKRKLLTGIAAFAAAVAVVMALLTIWALYEREEAGVAKQRARNASLMAAARERLARTQPAIAVKLLLEVKPQEVGGWAQVARDTLAEAMVRVTLEGHRAPVRSAEFSADGKRIVTASEDNTARVWNADGTGEPLVLKGHDDPVRSATFSPDGSRVLTASQDHTVRIWRVSIPALLESLRSATSDCLPPDVRRTYLDETEPESRERYEDCMRSHGRVPFYPDQPRP